MPHSEFFLSGSFNFDILSKSHHNIHMPSRKKVPKHIWGLPVIWTREETDVYLSSKESVQDSMDIKKYLQTRGEVSTTMYDHIVSIQMSINRKKNVFSLAQFRKLFHLMKMCYPQSKMIQNRTHLVRRHQKMMKIFLEDFKDCVIQTINDYHFCFDGSNWNSPYLENYNFTSFYRPPRQDECYQIKNPIIQLGSSPPISNIAENVGNISVFDNSNRTFYDDTDSQDDTKVPIM